jgi:hypothetical protein
MAVLILPPSQLPKLQRGSPPTTPDQDSLHETEASVSSALSDLVSKILLTD